MIATIHHGELPLVIEGPDEYEGDDGELDNVRLTLLLDTSSQSWRAALASAGYARKTKLGGGTYHSMWVRTAAKSQATDITSEVAIDCIGLLVSGEKRRRVLGVGGSETAIGPNERIIIVTEELEGEDPQTEATVPVRRRVPKLDAEGEVVYRTIVTPSGSAERWNVKTAFLTVTDTYFAVGAPPSTTLIGTAQTPPTPPTTPADPWGSYDAPKRGIHPNGWVLDDRQVDEIFVASGSDGLYQVRDTYGFYYVAVPD
jgi:hypothetical protein